MLQRILLPLDGSALSEAAIPLAQTLARAQGAELILTRVVPPLTSLFAGDGYVDGGYMSPETYDEVTAAVEQEATDYLTKTAERLRTANVLVTTQQPFGVPVSALLDCEEQTQPDLVIMATHGRTGLARFALGSIADRMVREGRSPVLLARAFSLASTDLESALVPLDGSKLAEEALPMAQTLAGRPLHVIHLLRAISAADEQAVATAYLNEVAGRLSPLGVQVSVTVPVDEPSRAIATAAEQVDMVILSTHGRSGFDRLRHGSVAEQATRHLATPTLLVRAGTVQAT